MMTIAEGEVTSSALPSAFFACWADMASWPEWNTDTEWVRLDGPFATGSTGELKPKGGPKVKFVIESLVPEREFLDVSLLLGARLSFRHVVEPRGDRGCTVRVTITIDGPLARVWKRILGNGLATSLEPDLVRLAARAEAA
jgi:hypothetical protein